ncbi:BREX-1 system adenine-specific DNA-methyltransferase PglX [Synechococcus sp. CCY 0621]|uniref:BREX-1 system adenine-specific DNA-methyltransferase PglX n=1 Tax=Synechococcus sp. CCY 0621 TaxID=2815603 RepID=UPI001C21349C|nr:BREX-1 system adenine-specific DNA-methyltransferase PglX [Synechococcus sp. CCY 0621]
MEKEQRNRLQKATQDARRLLEDEFRSQLLQTYDIDVEKVRWAEEPGAHLQAEQRLIREKLMAWIGHKEAQINDRKEALLLALREMAFTALNRFVALKLMEARELVRPCVSSGLESEGFQEFTAVAQGLLADQEGSYRLYLETIFEDVSRELRALFDPRDPASLLWPKRSALLELLVILNRTELDELWEEDETLGWVYQYFNGDAERKKMREESAAPRNSRELAVRNQFFTPRYVVEFLTDNTLGRIWHEMRQGNSGLKDRCRYLVRRPNEIWLLPGEKAPAGAVADKALSQEELLQQPVHTPHRPLKDPREIRMLDPACGSMHFGLYAFDLYLEIYAEAWEIAQGSDEQAKQGEAFAPFVTYAASFADKVSFLREMPRLILQHNIHGIDIDPRATQIARLTLWLRAQRAWQEQQVENAGPGRPQITRSNVVCAEPMPGERELLADFVDQQFPEEERGLVQQLLEAIFDKMQLAGEAGSLLKIEEEIRDAIDEARRKWQQLAIQQGDLFSPAELAALGQVGSSLNTDLQNLTKDFWVDLERRIYKALRDYAYQAESQGNFQSRLFAEDAAAGFAFIETSQIRYDVVLMNPPFGEAAGRSESLFSDSYAYWAKNILCAFIGRCSGMLKACGMLGVIADRTVAIKSTYEEFRKKVILGDFRLETVLDLGWGVLDANVETISMTLCKYKNQASAICIDKRESHVKSELEPIIHGLLSTSNPVSDTQVRFAQTALFHRLPNSVLGFDFPEFLVRAFGAFSSLEETGFRAYGGHSLKADRHNRVWWELSQVSPPDQLWPMFNGSGFSPYSISFREVAISPCALQDFPIDSATVLRNTQIHGRHGLCFAKRGEYFCAHVAPAGLLFTQEGRPLPIADKSKALLLLAYLNTPLIRYSLNKYCGQHKTSGYVNLLPIAPDFSEIRSQLNNVMEVCAIATDIKGYDETSIEYSNFLSTLARNGISPIEALNSKLAKYINMSTSLEQDCEQMIESMYSVSNQEAELLEAFSRYQPKRLLPIEDLELDAVPSFYFRSLISEMLGHAFGRWNVQNKDEDIAPQEFFDPFAALPLLPSVQLINGLRSPAIPDDLPADYPLIVPWEGILVDDPSHPLDIELRIREVINIIWNSKGGDNAFAITNEACETLGVATLRDYFRRPTNFFADHLKRYSKSRRQAPIYWQLSAGSGSYSVWLYYHRFTTDTLYQVLGIVKLRLEEAEREISDLGAHGALSVDAANCLQEAQCLLADLRILKSELDLVSPLWNPYLNDGVIINHAVLWRITPFTPWQKKCKECWDKLVNGDYDWGHLAFHLWPERVIKKCQSDRSLAIAHGLEERLWQETNKGNWLPRKVSESELQALIAEHSKPAVQNALERFLSAPPPVAAARIRAPRAEKSSFNGTTRRSRGSATPIDAEASRQTLLVLTAAPAEGLGRNAIADLLDVEAASLTAVIKQLKESGQIEQLGAAKGTKYRLTEQGRAALASQAGEED